MGCLTSGFCIKEVIFFFRAVDLKLMIYFQAICGIILPIDLRLHHKNTCGHVCCVLGEFFAGFFVAFLHITNLEKNYMICDWKNAPKQNALKTRLPLHINLETKQIKNCTNKTHSILDAMQNIKGKQT